MAVATGATAAGVRAGAAKGWEVKIPTLSQRRDKDGAPGRSKIIEKGLLSMTLKDTGAATTRVVRVRETQQYDVEVMAATEDSREVARLARRRFMDMTIDEQSANSVGVSARSFAAGEDEFDDDELTGGE
jgi:hypothetical protein